MNGEGTMNWLDGRKYTGQWMDGMRHGQGKLSYPDGRVKEGEWEDGDLLD